jgi:hypothetical protein
MFENVLLVIFLLMAVFFYNKNFNNFKLFFFCISFILTLSILIGLLTPVLGAIVRYKTPLLPFLFTALLMLTDKEKMNLKRWLGKFSRT